MTFVSKATAIALITTFICFFNVFVASYITGSTTVYVNNFGEGNLEFVMLILTIPLVAKYLYDEFLRR
jgi:hypothetical protein